MKQTGKRYGYARVSTKGQARDGNSLDDQERALTAAGCDRIEKEAYTGTKMGRPKFTKLVEKLQPGDTLVVCKLDRFARTAREGLQVIEDLMARGVKVHILNMGLIEDTPMGRVILTVLLAFAQFERDSIVERTSAGKVLAREGNPDYKEGRKEIEIPERFHVLVEGCRNGEITVVSACDELGISRSTWYKWVKKVA